MDVHTLSMVSFVDRGVHTKEFLWVGAKSAGNVLEELKIV